jgi:hypothetical protein
MIIYPELFNGDQGISSNVTESEVSAAISAAYRICKCPECCLGDDIFDDNFPICDECKKNIRNLLLSLSQ